VGFLTNGEGWHNNHHRVPYSARHGFAWYEFDASYQLIRVLAWLLLVWAVKRASASLMAGGGIGIGGGQPAGATAPALPPAPRDA